MRANSTDSRVKFANQLVRALKQVYGGRLPSLSVIARDLSLKSPHLPHVSNETVRKWIRGAAYPQSPRMQALVEWLGQDIIEPLQNKPQQNFNPETVQQRLEFVNKEIAVQLFDTLNANDKILVINIMQAIIARVERAEAEEHIADKPNGSTSNSFTRPLQS